MWAYVEVEDVGEMMVDDVRDALVTRGMSSDGSGEEVRERLVLAILAEEASERERARERERERAQFCIEVLF